VFGIVHPHSSHHYELAYLLGYAGVRPGADVELTVVPPSLMADALAGGQLDGFCAGEPWGSIAVSRGAGVIATTKAAIWRSSPEKVLGMRLDWAERNAERLASLLCALYLAACWCDVPENRPRLAAILSHDRYLDLPEHLLLASLEGRQREGPPGASAGPGSQFMFAERASTFPWSSHAAWFYSQMVRWGQVEHTPQNAAKARATFRPDIYRAALGPLGIAVPSSNAKVEGALTSPTPVGSPTGRLVLGPDGFFDGRIFDPARLDAYIAGFADRT
jgi:NitT/TauT family transport system ATP-binding protein